MDVSIKENGNVVVDGKEYIPMSRLEEDIAEATAYNARRKCLHLVVMVLVVVVSFVVGYAIG